MALLFMDGFDAGDVGLKWLVSGSPSSSTSTRLGTGRCISMPAGVYPSVTKVFSGSYNKVYLGFAYQMTNTDSDTIALMQNSSGTTILSAICMYPDFRVTAGSVTVTTSGQSLAPGNWYYIEIGVYFAASGGTLVLRINNNTVASGSGNTGAQTMSRIALLKSGSYWSTTSFDDVYVCDDSGAAPQNTFLGDSRIHTIVPNGAGSSTQFTPSSGANYTTVDELPYSASDYVYGTAGQTDLYATSDLPGGAGVIYGLQTSAIVKKTDAGSISARAAIKTGGTVYYGTTTAVGTSDQVVSRIDQINPATSLAWTSGDVNAIENGIGAL